jgi:hypothetical protein
LSRQTNFQPKHIGMINESKVRELIKRQKETGLNITAFCANEGIPKSSYYYWRKRLRNEPGKRFIQLQVNAMPSTINGPAKNFLLEQAEHHDSCEAFPMEISYPNGTTLRIRQTLDLAGLRSLVLLVD